MPERCPECGSEILAGGAQGLCPQCLLGIGLSAEDRSSPRYNRGPDSALLTLPPGALGAEVAEATAGAPREIASETESLLRGRIQAGASMIFVGVVAFVLKDLVAPGDTGLPSTFVQAMARFAGRAALLVFYGATIAVLRGPRPLSLRQLQALEVAIVWVVALWFAGDRLFYFRSALENGSAAELLWALSLAVMTYFAFLSAYGLIVPNTWKRAFRVTGLLALMPVAVLAVFAATEPEGTEFLRRSLTLAQVLGMGLILAIGVMIATWGAHRIHTLRLEIFEAKRLGQYRLTERIGRGGMGEVWKADHRLLARPAAIKLVKAEIVDAGDPVTTQEMMRSFEREAQTTASLRSAHTVELYDFGVTDEAAFYYVMELLDGKDLHTLVRDSGPLPPERVVYLLEQVCDSLADAHDKGLVHRDIKPANIYVCRMGQRFDFVKVLDFGLVKVRSRRDPASGRGGPEIVGTPSFIAPEMAMSSEVDGRADIYSLGCVGYWMLTGLPVFEGNSSSEVVAKHIDEQVVPPSDRVSGIPPVLEEIIMRCLEKEPEARPQGAEELARALRDTGLVDEWTQERARACWSGPATAGEARSER